MSKKQETSQVNKVAVIAVILGVFVVIAAACFLILPPEERPKVPAKATSDAKDNNETQTPPVDEGDLMSGKVNAVIDIKDYGIIKVELDADNAPITVTNFVNLANSGFYNGLTFHRIMEGFMMQGGDPLGNGTGGSDYNIKGEFAANGVENPLSHTRGAISMARSNHPDSASSQFFICHEDALGLDGDYACFGYVTEGIEVVDAVCESSNPIDGNGTILPEEQPIINSITIEQ